jgi:hypothetical protein
MDETEREEVFLTNAALGTNLPTSYAAADDELRRRRGFARCLVALLADLPAL